MLLLLAATAAAVTNMIRQKIYGKDIINMKYVLLFNNIKQNIKPKSYYCCGWVPKSHKNWKLNLLDIYTDRWCLTITILRVL